MNKLIIILFTLIVVLALGNGFYDGLSGMATKNPVVYKCTDNDFSQGELVNTKGVVVVTSSQGERRTYTDGCVDGAVRENSCDPDTDQQYYTDFNCSDGKICKSGYCQ